MNDVGIIIQKYEKTFGKLPEVAFNVHCGDEELGAFMQKAMESGLPADFELLRRKHLSSERRASEDLRKAYFDKFGDIPSMPPLELGRRNLTTEQYDAYMQAAIDAGKPVNWDNIFPSLPEGADS